MPRKPIDYLSLIELRCSCCGVVKPVSEFSKTVDATAPLTGWRYRSYCKACNREKCKAYSASSRPKRNVRMKKWRKANPAKAKANDRRCRLRMIYGLSPEDYDAMVKKQRGRCPICRQKKPLVIDHHHGTGAVRKLICNRCNFIVGLCESASHIVDKCREYISEHEQPTRK